MLEHHNSILEYAGGLDALRDALIARTGQSSKNGQGRIEKMDHKLETRIRCEMNPIRIVLGSGEARQKVQGGRLVPHEAGEPGKDLR